MKRINKKDIIILIIIIATFLMYISLSFNDSVWQDEAYTMNIIKKDLFGIARTTAGDVHPPLYYCMAKIFTMIFGYSVTVVKVLSIIPVTLIMIFVWIKSKQLFSDKYCTITIVFSLLIGFVPIAFKQNIELRMYTWAMFFVTCSGIYAYELYLSPKNKIKIGLFVFTGLCAAYTHYYAAVTEFFISMFLIISLIAKHKAWKESLIIINSTIALYIPWLPVFVKQFINVRDTWWLDVFDINTILSFITYPFGEKFTNAYVIVVATIIIGMLTYIIKNKKDKQMWFAIFSILSCILMIATGSIMSLALRPVFVVRYIYVAIGLLFLGISIGISKIEYGNLIRNILVAIIIVNIPFSYYSAYQTEYETGTEEFKEFAKNNIKPEIIISTNSNDIVHTLPYYLPENELRWVDVTKNTRGYVFVDMTLEEMRETIPDAQVKELYSGNIDGIMWFRVFFVE